MEVNAEKRQKFMENAGKRVNKVMHDIQILEPMARSNAYDFTKEDVEEMFNAMQETLNDAKAEFYKKFEEKAKSEKKVFAFGTSKAVSGTTSNEIADSEVIDEENSVESSEEDVVVF